MRVKGVACLVLAFAPNLLFATAAHRGSTLRKYVPAEPGEDSRYESRIISVITYADVQAVFGSAQSEPSCNRAGARKNASITSESFGPRLIDGWADRVCDPQTHYRNQVGAQPLTDVWSWHPRSLAPDTFLKLPFENDGAAGQARACCRHQNRVAVFVVVPSGFRRQREWDGRSGTVAKHPNCRAHA